MHRSYSADSQIYQGTDGRDMVTPDTTEGTIDRTSRPMKRASRLVQARTRSFEQSDEERAASAQGDLNRGARRQTYRDTSWDKKWQQHLTDNQKTQKEEGMGSVYQTRQRRPGRLNRSYWENMAGAESRLPPRTPPPKRMLRDSPAECPNGPCGTPSPRRKLRESPLGYENTNGAGNSRPNDFLQNEQKSSQESERNEQNVIETETKHEMKMTQLDASCLNKTSDNGSEHEIKKEGQQKEVAMNVDITNKTAHNAKEKHEHTQSIESFEKVETVLDLSTTTSTSIATNFDKIETVANGKIPSDTKLQEKGDTEQCETPRSQHHRLEALSPAMDGTLMDAVQDVSNKLSDAVLVMTDVAMKRPQETPPPPTPPASPPPEIHMKEENRRLSYLPSPPPEVEEQRRASCVSNSSLSLESRDDRSVPVPPQRSASFKCKTKAPGTPPVKRSSSDAQKQRHASKTPEPQRKSKTPEPPKQSKTPEMSNLTIECQPPNLPLSRTPEPESPGTPTHRRKLILRATKTPSPSPPPPSEVKVKVREELVRAKSMLSSKKVNMTAALEALEQAYQDLESVVASDDERDESDTQSEMGRLTPKKLFIFGGEAKKSSSILRMELEEDPDEVNKDSVETSNAKVSEIKIKEELSQVIHRTPLMFTPEPPTIEVSSKSMLKEETSRKKHNQQEEQFESKVKTSEKRTSRERFEETQTNDQLIRASGTFQAIPITLDDTLDDKEPFEIATDETEQTTFETECSLKADRARKEVEKQVQFQKWKDEKMKHEEYVRLQSLKDKERELKNSKSTDIKCTVLSQEAMENKKMGTVRKDFMESMLIKENQTSTNELKKIKLEELRAMEDKKRKEEEHLLEEFEKKRKGNKSPKVGCPTFTSISCTTERNHQIQESEKIQSLKNIKDENEKKKIMEEERKKQEEEKYKENLRKQEEEKEQKILKQKEAALKREKLIQEEVEQRERKKQQEELKQRLHEQKQEEEKLILKKKQDYLKQQEEKQRENKNLIDEAKQKEENNLEDLRCKNEAAKKREMENQKEKLRQMEEEKWNEEVKLLEEANKKIELFVLEDAEDKKELIKLEELGIEEIKKKNSSSLKESDFLGEQKKLHAQNEEMNLLKLDISNKKLSYSSVETNSAIHIEELEDRSLIEDFIPNCLIETPKDEFPAFNFQEEPKLEHRLSEREKVRLWEKELAKNSLKAETSLYHDTSYQGNNNKENKFSMSGLLKDVNIGLVKNRANIFGKPDVNTNVSSGKSPRIKRKILQPSSWFKKDSDIESNGYVELIQDKNVQQATQKWEESKFSEPTSRINLNNDTSIQGNTDKIASMYKNELTSPTQSDTFTPTHFIGDVMKDVKPDEKVHYHHNIMEQKDLEDFQQQVVLNDSTDSSKNEAPWRQNTVIETDQSTKLEAVKSPSLNLVSFSITPSITSKENNSKESIKSVQPGPKQIKSNEKGNYLWMENWESVQDLEETEFEETIIKIEDCRNEKNATEISHTFDRTTQAETSSEITHTFSSHRDQQSPQTLAVSEKSEKQQNNLNNSQNDSTQTVSKLRPTSPKEAVEELEKTIKQLEQHAEDLGETIVIDDQAKSFKLTSSAEMVNAAAETVKDAAGAVREVAETLLRTMTPDVPDILDSKEIPKGTVKSTQNQYLIQSSPETRRKMNKSPQDLQDVHCVISGKVKSNQTMFNQNSPKSRRKAAKSPQDLQDVKDVISGKVRNAQTILSQNSPEVRRKAAGSPQDLQDVQDSMSGKVKGTASMWHQIAQQHEQPERVEIQNKGQSRRIGNMLKARNKTWSDEEIDSDEDSYGYEDDFSSGIDLPTEITSGNVTPIPTTGELEELSSIDEPTVIEDLPSTDKPESEARTTPLKSLLKKPSFDADDSCSDSDSDSEDGKSSPKKVHFSEIDQVKLMSQESLASMANSEGSEATMPVTMCTTSITTTATPSRARIVHNKPRQEDGMERAKDSKDVMEKALGDMKDRAEQSYFVSKPDDKPT